MVEEHLGRYLKTVLRDPFFGGSTPQKLEGKNGPCPGNVRPETMATNMAHKSDGFQCVTKRRSAPFIPIVLIRSTTCFYIGRVMDSVRRILLSRKQRSQLLAGTINRRLADALPATLSAIAFRLEHWWCVTKRERGA